MLISNSRIIFLGAVGSAAFVFITALLTFAVAYRVKISFGDSRLECFFKLVSVHNLVLGQIFCNKMQRFHVFEKYFFCELVAFFNYGMNLVINLCGNFFGIVTCLREFFSEENLLMALTAKRYGVKKVVPKMSRLGYLDIVSLTGLDSVISPKAIIAGQISSYVRGLANSQGSAVESLHYILGGAIEAVEFTATPATHFLDRPLSDLAFRKGLLVAAIVHEGKMQIPNGQSQIRAGDRVIVMAQELFLQDLNDILG